MLPLTSTLTPMFTFIIILEMIEGKRKKYSLKRLALYGLALCVFFFSQRAM
jgi:hypothetical protein